MGPSPHHHSALMLALSDRLILDSGASAILLRESALHLLRSFFTVAPLPPLIFSTPTSDTLHATTGGHLHFPNHAHAIPCYVLPDHELSHSLLSVSSLLGPDCKAVFTPYAVEFFDCDSPHPYLTGHKLPQESLWSLTPPQPPALAASLPPLADPANSPTDFDNLEHTLGEKGAWTLGFLETPSLEFGLHSPRPVFLPPPPITHHRTKPSPSRCFRFRHCTQYP